MLLFGILCLLLRFKKTGLSGCDENGVFSINLDFFVEDPGNTGEEEGIDTIEIIGEVPGASLAEIVEGTLSITPELNWDQDILVSLIATDLNGDESDPAEFTLDVTPVNDLPEILSLLKPIGIDEDCGGDSCNDTNKIELTLDMFDVSDVEDEDEDLTLFIDTDNLGSNYSTDGLGIYVEQDYYGQITVPVYVKDSDDGRSDNFGVDIIIFPINDAPFFEGDDILVDEDQIFTNDGQIWAFNISPGPENESNQNTSFEISFLPGEELINTNDSYSLFKMMVF